MIRRPPRSTLSSSSAASDVYKRQDQLHTRLMLFVHVDGLHPVRVYVCINIYRMRTTLASARIVNPNLELPGPKLIEGVLVLGQEGHIALWPILTRIEACAFAKVEESSTLANPQ
eukprot:TRINITY_DN4965_c0_g1_i14.p1 TRINITY_DN4965_c0_g1~~TRINITY_DN4965_c0_g1_i14.p1  ORF type:complete len:115 (+),score=7.69 TRINITY_DN4965_c0_g1_i14:145-489(+)